MNRKSIFTVCLGEGERLPKGYGWGVCDYLRDKKLAHPIPLNFLFVLFHKIYIKLLSRPRRDARERDAFWAGYNKAKSIYEKK